MREGPARRLGWGFALACAGLAGFGAAVAAHPAHNSLKPSIESSPGKSAIAGGKGLTIHTSHRAAKRDPLLVYSVRLRDFHAQERVRAVGSVTPAYCAGTDINGHDHLHSPCQRLAHDHIPNPDYPIKLEALLYRAHGATEKSTAATEPLKGGSAKLTCTKARHHCPLTAQSKTSLGRNGGRFVNLSVIAWTHSRRWHRKDRLDLDCFKVNRICRSTPANAPDPGDPSQRALQTGQLAAIRLGGNYDKRSRAASTRIDDADVAVNSGPYDLRTVVHSARLDDLVPGEVIEAGGTVDVTGHGYDHFGGSYWILARDPATAQAMTGTPDRYLSAMNGVNCLGESPLLTGKTSGYCSTTRQPPTLPIRQLGVGKVPRSAPSTMYLNYVVLAGDGSIPDGVTPSAHVDSGSFQLSCDPVPSAQPCSFARP